jgi:hypothetical protein
VPKANDGTWTGITQVEAVGTQRGEPVPGFPLQFEWHTGPWMDIFDLQLALIKQDVRRARAEDRLTVYLSCPISARGGGYSGTNVDIARFTERALLQRWGEGFWILNPAQYQLESKAGSGLMEEHAKRLHIDLNQLRTMSSPTGGDYLRMWTKALVENDAAYGFETDDPNLRNTGQHFDAFYFLGPRDVQAFFVQLGVSLTAGIENYFSRREATDADFRDSFAIPGLNWGAVPTAGTAQASLRDRWERVRIEFFRYYGLRASGNFSLGSHDEWNIYCQINLLRRTRTAKPGQLDGDVSIQLAGYFDGGQLDPASTEAGVSRGYAL